MDDAPWELSADPGRILSVATRNFRKTRKEYALLGRTTYASGGTSGSVSAGVSPPPWDCSYWSQASSMAEAS